MSSSDKGVSQCSEAVVDHYGVTFSCLGSSLQKLTTKQEGLAAAVQQEDRTLNEERGQHRVEQMVSITGIYRSKLDRIREEMGTLSARSARLRQRAARLQLGAPSALWQLLLRRPCLHGRLHHTPHAPPLLSRL